MGDIGGEYSVGHNSWTVNAAERQTASKAS